MPIAITDAHRELEQVARAFLEKAGARAEARALLDAPEEKLPAFWDDLVGLGWLGLHLPEDVGGSGYGLPELVVVVQELGRALGPGPFLPTVLASTVVATAGSPAQRAALLPALADGSRPATLPSRRRSPSSPNAAGRLPSAKAGRSAARCARVPVVATTVDASTVGRNGPGASARPSSWSTTTSSGRP